MNAIHEIDDPSIRQLPGHSDPAPFRPRESESFDIRDLEPHKLRKPEFSRRELWIRLLIYVGVISLVVFWFALKVAGTLD